MERFNNLLYYTLLVGIFGYFSYYLHSRSMFLLFLFFLIFPVFSCILAKYTAGKLTVKAVPKALWAAKGEKTSINFVFENTSLIPVLTCRINFKAENRYLENNIINSLDVSVPARESHIETLPITPVYNGIINISITNASVRDMLNIFSFKVKKTEGCCFYISPTLAEKELTFSRAELYSEESLITAKNVNGTQIDGVRDYAAGDKLRNIHWKLSAKQGDLLVKEYSDNNEESAILLAELFAPCIDSITDAVYAAGKALIKMGCPYTLGFASAGSEQLTKLYITNENALFDGIKAIYLACVSQSDSTSLYALRREYAGSGIIYIHGSTDGKAVTDII
ncbi:MAG: DUF58 domain-containing protein [Firmicutes bacterium]|nr:DUF58 domain-containing protein [Bacillota bacterium]